MESQLLKSIEILITKQKETSETIQELRNEIIELNKKVKANEVNIAIMKHHVNASSDLHEFMVEESLKDATDGVMTQGQILNDFAKISLDRHNHKMHNIAYVPEIDSDSDSN